MNDELPVLVEVSRGAIVESRHRGVIIAVEPDDHVVARLGDDRLITSTRSTIKPIQAIPIITSGAADHFKLTSRELAVACASHEGEPIHTETVFGMLARAGLDETALRCGAHAPYNPETARQLEQDGLPFTQIHNNCSGKHAGMLMTAVHRKLDIEDYHLPDHPVQREIISALARLSDLDENMTAAIDGCSAPTFAVPLRSLAVAFARLVSMCGAAQSNPQSWFAANSDLAEAARRIVPAMIEHPELVGGTKRFDTDLLRAARGKLICKVGAEAVYSIGVLPSEQFPRGLGIAFKMEDGSYRGLAPAVVETLVQLGVLSGGEAAALSSYRRPIVENRRGLNVGEVRAIFDLTSNKN
ncbi:MAG TPA: asparaginase [Blastocatellia bacterium]|nr:asparaginase [Blastocatellia bacterium]